MDIIGAMTAGAIPRQWVLQGTTVTLVTTEVAVLAGQGEIGVLVMVEQHFAPAGFIVALLAFTAVAAEMNVVAAVTTVALKLFVRGVRFHRLARLCRRHGR